MEIWCIVDSNCLDSVGKVALYPLAQLISHIKLNSQFAEKKEVVDSVKSLYYVKIHSINHISDV